MSRWSDGKTRKSDARVRRSQEFQLSKIVPPRELREEEGRNRISRWKWDEVKGIFAWQISNEFSYHFSKEPVNEHNEALKCVQRRWVAV